MYDDRFEPTMKGFLLSWRPSQMFLTFPQSEEETAYFLTRTAMLVGPAAYTFAQTPSAAAIALHGSNFAARGYAATNSYGAYKIVRDASRFVKAASTGPGAVALTAAAAHHYVMSNPPPTEALASEPGQTSWWRAVAQSIGAGGFGAGGFEY